MLQFDKPFIFISYAREDLEAIRQEIQHIKNLNYNVWYDLQELTPGYAWEKVIKEALEACSCFVVFITRTSVRSEHVAEEINDALKARKPFIGIYLEQVKFLSPLQDKIDKIQALERYRLPPSAYQEQLSRALSEHILLDETEPPAGSMKEKIDKNYVPGSSTMPQGVSWKAVFFILTLCAVFFTLLAIAAISTSFFATQGQDGPLNDRLNGYIAGSVFIVFAACFGAAAFIVHRKYLRRKND